MIDWLPTNVETLLVAKKPFTVKAESQDQPIFQLRELVIGNIKEGDTLDTKGLLGKTILIGIEACRDFRFPGGNDTNTDEGCHIFLFKEPLNFKVEDLPGTILTIDDTNVVNNSEKVGLGTTQSYIALPQKNLLVETSSENYMRTILSRMKSRAGKRAMPASLQEWQFVSKDAAFYALRHYEKISADPMSPYDKHSMWDACGRADKQAIGFVVSADDYHPEILNFWYFSKNPKGIKTLETVFRGDEPRTVKTKRLFDNCWKLEVAAAGQDRSWLTFVNLMALLGRTPYF